MEKSWSKATAVQPVQIIFLHIKKRKISIHIDILRSYYLLLIIFNDKLLCAAVGFRCKFKMGILYHTIDQIKI